MFGVIFFKTYFLLVLFKKHWAAILDTDFHDKCLINVQTTCAVHFAVWTLNVSPQFRQQQLSDLNFPPHVPILWLLLEERPAVDAAAATQCCLRGPALQGESAAFWQSLQCFVLFFSLTTTIPGAALWRFRSSMFGALQLALPYDILYFTRRNESIWHCKKKQRRVSILYVWLVCTVYIINAQPQFVQISVTSSSFKLGFLWHSSRS